MKLYTIDTDYINFLKQDPNLSNVLLNEKNSPFARKYIGVVFDIGKHKYYAPLASPKRSDYDVANGETKIKKNTPAVIRIVSKDTNGNDELKGTIKLNNMIPVPNSVITLYDISAEPDGGYRLLVKKEYKFIQLNQGEIKKRAELLYHQKNKEKSLSSPPGYLKSTIDFKLAEARCKLYPVK